MAKLKKKSNKLGRSHLVFLLAMIVSYLACAFCLWLSYGFIRDGEMQSLLYSLLAFVAFAAMGNYMHKKTNILASGLKGEREAAKLIKKLPEGYRVFQNVNILFDGRESELDLVVVGKSGVFVIETKNMAGEISGNYNSQNWNQTKYRGRQTHKKTFYNPIKQVGTHVYRLANFLRRNKINVNVSAAVYFANPEAELSISGEEGNIALFSKSNNGEKALLEYIKKGTENISKDKLKSIDQLLDR